jgi:hypothetical protein
MLWRFLERMGREMDTVKGVCSLLLTHISPFHPLMIGIFSDFHQRMMEMS